MTGSKSCIECLSRMATITLNKKGNPEQWWCLECGVLLVTVYQLDGSILEWMHPAHEQSET